MLYLPGVYKDCMDLRPSLFAYAAAGLVPIGFAAAMVGVRNELDSANVALLLVLVVVCVAALGGRGPAAVSAVVAAASFDFFLTRPYNSLRIGSADDLETTLILLAIGAVVGQVAVLGRRRQADAQRRLEELARLGRVANRVAVGGDVDGLIELVEAEECGLLSLRRCEFLLNAPDLPLLGRDGTVRTSLRVFQGREFSLPAEGVRIPVVGGGRELGSLVLEPDPLVGVSIEERRVAVAIADQLGAALERRLYG